MKDHFDYWLVILISWSCESAMLSGLLRSSSGEFVGTALKEFSAIVEHFSLV